MATTTARPIPRIKSRRKPPRRHDASVAVNAADWLKRQEDDTTERLLFKKQLLEIVPLTFVTIWKMMRRGDFPRALVVGKKSCWRSQEIQNWMKQLPQRKYLGDK